MTWEQIYSDLDSFPARFEYYIEKLAEIYSAPNFTKESMFYKSLQVQWITPIKDISIEQNYKEVVIVNKNTLIRHRATIGLGNDNVLAERRFSMKDTIKYNFSEWTIINKKQLD